MQEPPKQLFIAPVHGFCGGVRHALDAVNALLERPERPRVYVYNEIVHNNFVVRTLEARGVHFVHDLSEVPPEATLVWSAHGVSPELEREAVRRNLAVVDATCPLVRKLHDLMKRHSARGDRMIVIGHAKHPETVGVLGCASGAAHCVSSVAECRDLPPARPGERVTVLSQTTWCREEVETLLAELRKKYPALELASGVCYATAERQQAVRDLIARHHIERLVVIGSPRSSNSNRLCDVALRLGVEAQLADDPAELRQMDWRGIARLGLTAGASAPEVLLDEAKTILRDEFHFEEYKENQP